MAKKRMMSMQIIDSDAFLDMPVSTQCLYFHLLARTDDEGFSNNPKKTMRMIKASDDDMKILLAKNYVIVFESGVLVIKHWLIHNTIRKDRLIPTVYTEEKEQLHIKENLAYTLNDNQMTTKRQPSVGIDKVRLVEDSIDKNRLDKNRLEDSKESMSVKKTDLNLIDPVKIDYEDIAEYWNTHSKLKEITKITEKRKPNVNARIKEFGLNSVYKMINQAGKSSFLRGNNKMSFHGTFDWCFKPTNYPKVLEGNYVDAEYNGPQKPNDAETRAAKLAERAGHVA